MVFKVEKIDEDSLAGNQGMELGDLIFTLGGQELTTSQQFEAIRRSGADPKGAFTDDFQIARIFRKDRWIDIKLPEGRLGITLGEVNLADEVQYTDYILNENEVIRSMRFVTIESPGDCEILQVFGTARGSTVRAKHVGRDIAASLKNIVGGELKGYTELMAEGREEAIFRMKKDAKELGANMIVGCRFTSAMIDVGACEITAYGTAVLVK